MKNIDERKNKLWANSIEIETAMNMRAMSCQTIQAQFSHNSGRDNMQFLVWPVHRTFARQ